MSTETSNVVVEFTSCANCGAYDRTIARADIGRMCEGCWIAEWAYMDLQFTADECDQDHRVAVRAAFAAAKVPVERTLYRITEPTFLASDGTDTRDTGREDVILLCGTCAPKHADAEQTELGEEGSGYYTIPTCEGCGRAFAVATIVHETCPKCHARSYREPGQPCASCEDGI